MTRFGLYVLFAALGVGLAACGSGGESSSSGGSGGSGGSAGGAGGGGGGDSGGSKKLADLVPGDNTVSGWTVDKEKNIGGTAAPMTASTIEEGMALIDGGIETFYKDGFTPKMFLWQNYMNSSLPDAPVDPKDPNSRGATIILYAFEMPSAEQASGLYKNLRKYSEYNPRTEWNEPTDPAVGTGSRIQDTNFSWWINFHKGPYYVEIVFDPSAGPAPDYEPGNLNLKKEAVRFAQAVASKM